MKFLVFLPLSLLIGCNSINQQLGLKDDNIAEEAIEYIILIETGFNLDLTPESKE
jgi:hypothetical protein